jgi:hypothetical protein
MPDYYVVYYEVDRNQKRTAQEVKVEFSDLALLVSGRAAPGCAATPKFEIPQSNPPARYCFVRSDDVKPFCDFAAKEKVFISVRNSGEDTVARLVQSGHGYACKPHEILEKTLKGKSLAKCKESVQLALSDIAAARSATFTLECQKADQDPVWWNKTLPGLTTGTPGAATGAAAITSILNYVKDTLLLPPLASDIRFTGFVGWLVWLKINATSPVFKRESTDPSPSRTNVFLSIPAGVLYVGPKAKDKNADKPHGMAKHFTDIKQLSDLPLDSYTGDYDLHCVYSMEPYYTDSKAVTGEIRTATAMKESGRKSQQGVLGSLYSELVDHSLYRKRDIVAYEEKYPALPTPGNDRYANLIQHGPQGQYLSSVDTYNKFNLASLRAKMAGADVEDEKIVASLLKVDSDGVLAFTPVKTGVVPPRQEVHLMRCTADVLAYYRHNGLASDPFSKGRLPDVVAARSLAPPLWRLFDAEVGRKRSHRLNEVAYTLSGRSGGLCGPDDSMIVLEKPITSTAISPEIVIFKVEEYGKFGTKYLFSSNPIEGAKSGRFRHVQGPLYVYVGRDAAGQNVRQVVAATRMFPPLCDLIAWELYNDNEMDDAQLSIGTYDTIVAFTKPMKADPGDFIDNSTDYATAPAAAGDCRSFGYANGFLCTRNADSAKQLILYKS